MHDDHPPLAPPNSRLPFYAPSQTGHIRTYQLRSTKTRAGSVIPSRCPLERPWCRKGEAEEDRCEYAREFLRGTFSTTVRCGVT